MAMANQKMAHMLRGITMPMVILLIVVAVVMLADKVHPLVMFVGILSLVRVTIMVTVIDAILYLPVITTNTVIVTNVTTYLAVKAINMVTAINVTTFGPVTQKITMAIVTMKAVIL